MSGTVERARRALSCVLWGAVFTVTASCASVSMFGEPAPEKAPRVDLLAAAEKLEETPWPASSEPDAVELMASILFGAKLDDSMPRAKSIEIYTAELVKAEDPVGTVLSDLEDIVSTANAVADHAMGLALTETRITVEDVMTVETAILTLKVHRDMFGSAFRALEKAGYAEAREARFAGDKDLNTAVRRLGEAADALSAIARESGKRGLDDYKLAHNG